MSVALSLLDTNSSRRATAEVMKFPNFPITRPLWTEYSLNLLVVYAATNEKVLAVTGTTGSTLNPKASTGVQTVVTLMQFCQATV